MIRVPGGDMLFQKQLPAVRTLRQLADIDGPFPLKAHYIVLAAERFNFDDAVISLLTLFPREEVFRSREEFIMRCEELESLIRGERMEAVAYPEQ